MANALRRWLQALSVVVCISVIEIKAAGGICSTPDRSWQK
jgi:hypothetical protein